MAAIIAKYGVPARMERAASLAVALPPKEHATDPYRAQPGVVQNTVAGTPEADEVWRRSSETELAASSTPNAPRSMRS
jgi:hypothetical protein